MDAIMTSASPDNARQGEQDQLAHVLSLLAVLQASVDNLPAEFRAAAPDISPTLGSMDQHLTAINAGLATVAKIPVKSAQDFEKLKTTLTHDAKRAAEEAARADFQAWKHNAEAEIVGRTVREQQADWGLRYGAAVAVGFMLYGVIAATLPGGSHLAAWATGHTDRWRAGQDLMKGANPQGWNQFVDAWNTVQKQEAAVQACKGQESLFPDGSLRPCEVVVPKAGAL